MTDEELAAIKARAEAATAGPWHVSGDGTVYSDDRSMEWEASEDAEGLYNYSGKQLDADAAFIAHARADIPALLAEVEAWRAVGRQVVYAEGVVHPYHGDYGPLVCAFGCVASQVNSSITAWDGVHSPDCSLSKARALLDKGEGEAQS